jgi:hypothetical protein
MNAPPTFDRLAYSPESRMKAARWWQSLLLQEDRSRALVENLVIQLERFDAPQWLVERARCIASDEARHVTICSHVVRELGFHAIRPAIQLEEMPKDASALAKVTLEVLVAGFAVAETMSVGGFAAARARARAPLARWALAEILRDEVGHGAFGEVAGIWAMRDWPLERRLTMWPACVAAMEAFEERAADARAEEQGDAFTAWLGAPPSAVVCTGLLRAAERWVLPRLARMGVLPATTVGEKETLAVLQGSPCPEPT